MRSSSPTWKRAATSSSMSTASRATSTSSGAARSASTRDRSRARAVTVRVRRPELGRKSVTTSRADPRRRRRGRRRGRVRARAVGPAARARRPITDAERASLDADRRRCPDERLEQRPRRRSPSPSPAPTYSARTTRTSPTRRTEIADSAIGANEAGATVAHLHVREDDGTPSGRPELFVDVIDRIRAGTRDADHGLDRRRQRHDDRGADDRPGGEAGHLRGRVGLDELRRRDLHHAAAGRPRDHRARHRGGHRARGRGLRRRPRGQRGPLARAGDAARRRCGSTSCSASPAASTRPRRRWMRCCARCRRRPSGPSPASAATTSGCSPWRCCAGARGSAPGLEDVAYVSAAASTPPRTRRWSGWPSSLRGALGREVATQDQTRELLQLGSSRRESPAAETAVVGRRGPETREAIDRRRDRAVRAARLPRDVDAGDRRRGRGAAGRDLPLVPEQGGDPGRSSRTTSWSSSTARVVAAIGRQERPALKLAAAVREHVVYHGVHRSEAFVTDSEIRALTDAPRRALIGKRDAYQAIFAAMIARRHPRRLAADLRRRTSRPTRSCCSAPGSRSGSTRPARSGSRRSPSSTSSSCSARCRRRAELIAEAIERVSREPALGRG